MTPFQHTTDIERTSYTKVTIGTIMGMLAPIINTVMRLREGEPITPDNGVSGDSGVRIIPYHCLTSRNISLYLRDGKGRIHLGEVHPKTFAVRPNEQLEVVSVIKEGPETIKVLDKRYGCIWTVSTDTLKS